jgi:hypothetical protein
MIRPESLPFEPVRAPAWARPSGSIADYSEAEALFFAGAALAALDSVARADPPWAGAWRRRLALKCAAAVAQTLLARREDEAALRDAVALARQGQELGPAGRIYSAFRTLCDRGDFFRPERLAAAAAALQSPLDPDRAGELAEALRGLGARPGPLVAAAGAAAVIALKRDAEALALLCADAGLARSFGWPTAAPLLAGEVLSRRAAGERRRPSPAKPAGPKPSRSPPPARRFRPSISPRICPAARPG